MSGDQIQYEELAQEALRSVIRKVMSDIEKTGELPGEHHFFIAFDTQAEGVEISGRLKAKYQEDMTIVLQHQFWDLRAEEDYFTVKLSFNNVMEKLVIPYNSIKVFFDPSVPYGLQFGTPELDMGVGQDDAIKTDILEEKNNTGPISPLPEITLSNKAAEKDESVQATEAEADEEFDENKSADIVSLDTFRKK